MILASVALLGIIGLQAYWLRQSILVKEEQFKVNVSEALSDFTRFLEKRRDADFIYENFQVLTDPSNALVDISGGLYNQPDSVSLKTFHSDIRGNPGVPDGLASQAGDGMEVVSSFSEQGKFFSSRGKVVIRTSRTDEGVRISRKVYQLDSMFLQIMKEEYSGEQPLENQLEQGELDSILAIHLRQHGIELPYAFGVYDGEWIPPLQTKNFNPKYSQYSAHLFPNHIRPQQSSIHVYFPGRRNYLLQSVWSTLVLGGIFTAIIVIAFGSSLRIAMRQKRLSEMKTDFINNMTHEFKTPIATISLALDAMVNEKVRSDSKKIEHYIQLVKQENKRMNQQVEDVLRLAMLERKELELRYEKVNMHDLLQEVASRFELRLQSRNGTLKLELSAENDSVRVDKKQMEAVVQNLLDNAFKYSPEDPKIIVRTANLDNEINVSIQDQGMGMKAETQRFIFDRFYRSETGNVHNIKGHGLGLAFVKGVLLMHNSRIQVKSAPGQGSTFTFNLSTYGREQRV
jgi:two-component system phosphate regulon sensor histidine kinase PhoR